MTMYDNIEPPFTVGQMSNIKLFYSRQCLSHLFDCRTSCGQWSIV